MREWAEQRKSAAQLRVGRVVDDADDRVRKRRPRPQLAHDELGEGAGADHENALHEGAAPDDAARRRPEGDEGHEDERPRQWQGPYAIGGPGGGGGPGEGRPAHPGAAGAPGPRPRGTAPDAAGAGAG